jgi:hypothetical protein
MAEENQVLADAKKPYASKTLWINFIMAGTSLIPSVKEAMTPDVLGVIFFVVNTVLRFVTKSGISIK